MSDLIDPAELDPDATLVIINAVAMPGFPPPMPGCELRPCAVCGRNTWAAPSSVAAEAVRTTKHLCRRCGAGFARLAGGLDMHRLPGADVDVTAPGSLVTREGEAGLLEEFRRGTAQEC